MRGGAWKRQAGRRGAARLRPPHAPAHHPHGGGGLSIPARPRQGARARAGDGIRLEDGRIVAVEAAPEQLLEIACGDERALARIAWHLGNRHLATEIGDRAIYIREDHVIADMVRGLGAAVRPVSGPSTPKAAPTARAPCSGHSHGHGHSHSITIRRPRSMLGLASPAVARNPDHPRTRRGTLPTERE